MENKLIGYANDSTLMAVLRQNLKCGYVPVRVTRTDTLTLNSVHWSYISTLMCLLTVVPRSTEGPLFSSQCTCRAILLTMYSIVWDWRV